MTKAQIVEAGKAWKEEESFFGVFIFDDETKIIQELDGHGRFFLDKQSFEKERDGRAYTMITHVSADPDRWPDSENTLTAAITQFDTEDSADE